MDKAELTKWLEGKIIELEASRDHAIQFYNYGKAGVLHGQLVGTKNVLSQIELGDFDK